MAAVNANSVLDDSDDDADATGRRLQAWERAYEADRCVRARACVRLVAVVR
jgi:hypothetical protein